MAILSFDIPTPARRTRWGLAWLAGALCLLLTAQPATADTSVRSFDFVGQTYRLGKIEQIANGDGFYFAPGGQNPDDATEEIILNVYDRQDQQGKSITADGLAESMLGQAKGRGATTVLPFKVPDAANKHRFVYYLTMYYLYPQDGNGDIWLSKILQSGDHVVGILYKHRIDGADANAIAENARAWLLENVKQYSAALDTVAIPGRK